MISKHWMALLSFFIILNTFLFYIFIRPPVFVFLAIILIFVYFRIGQINFFLLAVSYLITTLIFILIAEFVFHDKIYFRPLAKLSTLDWDGSYNFKKNKFSERKNKIRQSVQKCVSKFSE